MPWDGWRSPWPLQWGGGPSLLSAVHEARVSILGQGHVAEEDGVDWRWREARSLAYAAIVSQTEQAFYQYEPATATTGLVFWRELYRIPEGFNAQQARGRAAFFRHDRGGLDLPTVQDRLRAFDQRFRVTLVPAALTVDADPGTRLFEPWDGSLPFNLWGRRETRFGNHSTAFRLLVLFDLQGAPLGDVEREAIAAAREYLDEGVAWCDYSIATGVGFRAGRSPLGRTRAVV